MDIIDLVKLTERAWSLEILAALHRGVPGRQAPLIAATGAGRTAFGQSLQHLLDLGILERNPGHGHPLRPEFRMTARGAALGGAADAMLQAADGAAGQGLLRRRWTVPVLSVARKPRRFSDIRGDVGQVTDRALSQTILRLQEHGWMDRVVDPQARPVRPLYQASGDGLQIARIMTARM